MIKIESLLNVKSANNYEISPITMAVLSTVSSDGQQGAIVLEESQEYQVPVTPTKMVDSACVLYGSSLRGRLDGTRGISQITHKAPIAIDPASGIYFFPTMSPKHKQCSWISHSHVKHIEAENNNSQTTVHFRNGQMITIDVSFGIMLNQQHRTAQFRYALNLRMQQMHGKRKPENHDFDGFFNS